MPTSEPPLPLPLPLPPPPPKYIAEDKLTQECRDLMASLPRDRGWVAPYLYQYQGFWHQPRHLQGVLTCQQNFQAHDTDILLVTTPKSGTTWMKAILYALVHRKDYPNTHEDDHDHPLITISPHDLVPFLELKVYVDNQVPDIASSLASPRLFSTHLPVVSLPKSVEDSECKLVYLCRNPMDTFISLWHFTNKLRPPQNFGTNNINYGLEEMFNLFCRGVSLYGPFWDHVLGYWKKSLEKPQKVLFLKFEELKEQPIVHLKRIAEFIGCPFSSEEEKDEGKVMNEILRLCSFDSLSNLEVNKSGKMSSGEENKAFFRRGEVGDWKNYLTADMADRMDQISQQKLHEFGLKF